MTSSDDLKARVIAVKKELPAAVVPAFIHKFPEYDTYKKKSRVSNVLQLRIADADITEKLEQLAASLKPQSND